MLKISDLNLSNAIFLPGKIKLQPSRRLQISFHTLTLLSPTPILLTGSTFVDKYAEIGKNSLDTLTEPKFPVLDIVLGSAF